MRQMELRAVWAELKKQLLPTDRSPANPRQRGQGEQTGGNSEWSSDWAWAWLSGIPGKQAPRLTNKIFNFMVWSHLLFLKQKRRKKGVRTPLYLPQSSSLVPAGTREARSMQLWVSEEYLPSRRNGSNQTDVRVFHQKSHFGPALLLSEKFCLNVTLFNLLTILELLTCDKWLSPAPCSLNTKTKGCCLVLKWHT